MDEAELPPLPEFHGWIGASDQDPEAGVEGYTAEQMHAFYRQAVLAERERCAKLCERMAKRHGGFGPQSYLSGLHDGSIGCANAIRHP